MAYTGLRNWGTIDEFPEAPIIKGIGFQTLMQMSHIGKAIQFLCATTLISVLSAQTAKPAPDILLLIDGEKLIGHLKQSTGNSVVFQSDLAGTITVDWSKVQELRSSEKFAVIEKGTKLGKHEDNTKIPQGAVSVEDKNLTVAGANIPVVTIPLSQVQDVVDEAAFDKAALRKPGLFEDWAGSATAGLSLVMATQDSQTYTSSINLDRAIPAVAWMN